MSSSPFLEELTCPVCGHGIWFVDALFECGWLFIFCTSSVCRWGVLAQWECLFSGLGFVNTANMKVVNGMVEVKGWTEEKDKIERTPVWLRESDIVEVDFSVMPEPVETPRKDARTGREYKSIDYKIAIFLADGSRAFRMIDKYVLVDMTKAWELASPSKPKRMSYRRPVRRR